jgi:hypothetical protein
MNKKLTLYMSYDGSYYISNKINGLHFVKATHKSLGKEIETFLNSRLLRFLAKYLRGYDK